MTTKKEPWYIVRKPFKGTIWNIVDSGNYDALFTSLRRLLDQGAEVEIVNDETMTKMMAEYEATLVTPLKQIDAERYSEMMEILPPQRMFNAGVATVFSMSEYQYGNITTFFAECGSDYFEWHDFGNASVDSVRAKIYEAQEALRAE